MKRSATHLEQIADWNNLLLAAQNAARGKRDRDAVRTFFHRLDVNLCELGQGIRNGSVPMGESTCFPIRDPKPRIIHAPCFRERVLHHAIMNIVGPVLENTLIDDTFACLTGRGTLAAVKRCQQHIRRFAWFAKLDVRNYFGSIQHAVLKEQLARRFKSSALLSLLFRLIDSHTSTPGHGLPIGALTSQCFANFHLGVLDRFLLESRGVQGMVRYMDDFLFWGPTRQYVVKEVRECTAFVSQSLGLEVKAPLQLSRSSGGATFCGFRVFPGTIRLAASRRRRYRVVKRRWEDLWLEGQINPEELQRGYSAALAITLHADSAKWRGGVAQSAPTWHDDV